MKEILIVATNHDTLGSTGEKTGMWLEEFTAPYYEFIKAGFRVTIASPFGGKIPLDPKSLQPDNLGVSGLRYLDEKLTLLDDTVTIKSVLNTHFAALFYPGGHGPMWDLCSNEDNAFLLKKLAGDGAIISAVCHGPAALLSGGNALLNKVHLTGFSNTEEEIVGLQSVVPFSLEDALKKSGAIYSSGTPWQSYVVEDGIFITGQNPQSATAVGQKIVEKLLRK